MLDWTGNEGRKREEKCACSVQRGARSRAGPSLRAPRGRPRAACSGDFFRLCASHLLVNGSDAGMRAAWRRGGRARLCGARLSRARRGRAARDTFSASLFAWAWEKGRRCGVGWGQGAGAHMRARGGVAASSSDTTAAVVASSPPSSSPRPVITISAWGQKGVRPAEGRGQGRGRGRGGGPG